MSPFGSCSAVRRFPLLARRPPSAEWFTHRRPIGGEARPRLSRAAILADRQAAVWLCTPFADLNRPLRTNLDVPRHAGSRTRAPVASPSVTCSRSSTPQPMSVIGTYWLAW